MKNIGQSINWPILNNYDSTVVHEKSALHDISNKTNKLICLGLYESEINYNYTTTTMIYAWLITSLKKCKRNSFNYISTEKYLLVFFQ